MGNGTLQYRARTRKGLTSLTLTFCHETDGEILRREGISGLRKFRILRLLEESRAQGGVLRYQDLSVLMLTSPATIKRDLHELRTSGMSESMFGGRSRETGDGMAGAE